MNRRHALTAALAGLGLAILIPASANAQTVTDYDTYPAVVEGVPAGCAAPALTDIFFSLNGSPSTSQLADLPGFKAGDVLHMAWTGQTTGCEGTVVSLAIKHATQPFFDPAEDQELVAYLSGVADGLGGLTLNLPDLTPYDEGPCNYQVDAVVGPPLQVVGPDGSFYGPLPFPPRDGGGRNMLISAANGAYTECAPTTTTTTVVDASPPASGEAAPPDGQSVAPGEPSTGGGEPAASEVPPAAPAAAANLPGLPATGPLEIAAFAIWGAGLILFGGVAIHQARRLRADRARYRRWQP